MNGWMFRWDADSFMSIGGIFSIFWRRKGKEKPPTQWWVAQSNGSVSSAMQLLFEIGIVDKV